MKPQSKLRGITPSALWDNSTNALMSLDFHPKGTSPKRSDRKILERIIPPPSGDRDKLHVVRFQRVSLKFESHNKRHLKSTAIFHTLSCF